MSQRGLSARPPTSLPCFARHKCRSSKRSERWSPPNGTTRVFTFDSLFLVHKSSTSVLILLIIFSRSLSFPYQWMSNFVLTWLNSEHTWHPHRFWSSFGVHCPSTRFLTLFFVYRSHLYRSSCELAIFSSGTSHQLMFWCGTKTLTPFSLTMTRVLKKKKKKKKKGSLEAAAIIAIQLTWH